MREKNLDIYGDAPIPWSRALGQLESGIATGPEDEHGHKTYWLSTVDPGGAPHLAGGVRRRHRGTIRRDAMAARGLSSSQPGGGRHREHENVRMIARTERKAR
jgi:hypothetical protein